MGLAATGRGATGLAATGRAATVVGGGALTSPLRVGEVAVMGIRKSENATFINKSRIMVRIQWQEKSGCVYMSSLVLAVADI